jgi:hypothetical protein
MRPIGLRASTGIDSERLDCGFGVGRGVARDTGLAGFCDAGRTSEPGGGVDNTGGTDAGGDDTDCGGIDGGAYETGPCGITAGRAAGCGYCASSLILAVGASRCSPDAGCFAPQPPQNREFGSFSVPQVAQRIPPSA